MSKRGAKNVFHNRKINFPIINTVQNHIFSDEDMFTRLYRNIESVDIPYFIATAQKSIKLLKSAKPTLVFCGDGDEKFCPDDWLKIVPSKIVPSDDLSEFYSVGQFIFLNVFFKPKLIAQQLLSNGSPITIAAIDYFFLSEPFIKLFNSPYEQKYFMFLQPENNELFFNFYPPTTVHEIKIPRK